jgi:hypothetical protein
MKKTLKSIKSKYGMLNESYAWERTPGKSLPTLADVQEKYNAKSESINEKVAGAEVTAEAVERLARAVKLIAEMYSYAKKVHDKGDSRLNDYEYIKAMKDATDKIFQASVDLEAIADDFGFAVG